MQRILLKWRRTTRTIANSGTRRLTKGFQFTTANRFQIIAVDIAVGHLSTADREKCLKMEVIADAVADGEVLQARKTVADLMK